ncbi:MAG: hypothetical protein ABGY11_01985 [Candidatus Thioglobus sp.]
MRFLGMVEAPCVRLDHAPKHWLSASCKAVNPSSGSVIVVIETSVETCEKYNQCIT